MEQFSVLIVGVAGSPGSVPILCSNSIGLGDKILIERGVRNLAKPGVVESIDWDNKKANVFVATELNIEGYNVIGSENPYVVEVELSRCYYPIMELQYIPYKTWNLRPISRGDFKMDLNKDGKSIATLIH